MDSDELRRRLNRIERKLNGIALIMTLAISLGTGLLVGNAVQAEHGWLIAAITLLVTGGGLSWWLIRLMGD